jgi:hypothetical protein
MMLLKGLEWFALPELKENKKRISNDGGVLIFRS